MKSEIKEKLVPCAERGFSYRLADLAQSKQLLKLVLSNSKPANTREVDALGKTEAKQLVLKTSQSYVAYDDRDVLLFHQYSSEIGALVCTFGKCLEHLTAYWSLLSSTKGFSIIVLFWLSLSVRLVYVYCTRNTGASLYIGRLLS